MPVIRNIYIYKNRCCLQAKLIPLRPFPLTYRHHASSSGGNRIVAHLKKKIRNNSKRLPIFVVCPNLLPSDICYFSNTCKDGWSWHDEPPAGVRKTADFGRKRHGQATPQIPTQRCCPKVLEKRKATSYNSGGLFFFVPTHRTHTWYNLTTEGAIGARRTNRGVLRRHKQ